MWKNIFEIRVIRFEGVQVDRFEVRLEGEKVNLDKAFVVNRAGNYQISVESKESLMKVSFGQGLFEDNGMLWLPLKAGEENFIGNQPEEVNEPRVLLLVHKKIIEETHSAVITEENAFEHDFMPEIKLNYLENTMIIYEDTDEPSFCRSESNVCQEKSIEKDEENLRFQEILVAQTELAKKILEDKEEKEKELGLALEEISQLKNKLSQLEIENNYLKGMKQGLNFADLLKELAESRKKIVEIERKAGSAKENTGGPSETPVSLDKIVQEQCKLLNIAPLLREKEEIYVYNNKKINLLMKNGKLMVRTSSGLKEFHQFIEENPMENRQTVYNLPGKSPFRKYLGEINSAVDTPKTFAKFSDVFNKPNSTRSLSKSLQKGKIVKKK